MDILTEVEQLIKLLEIGYKDSALVALRAIRKELAEGQKPSHNKQSTPCPACGRDMECPNGCQSKHRSGVVLM
jgi:hypothetical protein